MPKEKAQDNTSPEDTIDQVAKEIENSAPKKGDQIFENKITPKSITLNNKIKPGLKGKFGGLISKAETVQTNYGESVRFIGEFSMINNEGVIIHSGRAFLPKLGEELLLTQFNRLKSENPEAKNIEMEFAFNIGTIEDSTANTGYRWVLSPIKEPEIKSQRALALLTGE